jgi:hypothetical protein
MRRKAQLRGQQLPAKKGKVRARLVQTVQIEDWDNLTPAQQQEALNWGIKVDISTDLDEDMSGQAGGSSTFTMAATGGGTTGGGGPPGGGGGPPVLRFAKRCPTWTLIMWMQLLMTQLWSSDTRYSNTRSPLYVRRRNSTSTKIDK